MNHRIFAGEGPLEEGMLVKELSVEEHILIAQANEKAGNLELAVESYAKAWIAEVKGECRERTGREIESKIVKLSASNVGLIWNIVKKSEEDMAAFVACGIMETYHVFYRKEEAGKAHVTVISIEYPDNESEERTVRTVFLYPAEEDETATHIGYKEGVVEYASFSRAVKITQTAASAFPLPKANVCTSGHDALMLIRLAEEGILNRENAKFFHVKDMNEVMEELLGIGTPSAMHVFRNFAKRMDLGELMGFAQKNQKCIDELLGMAQMGRFAQEVKYRNIMLLAKAAAGDGVEGKVQKLAALLLEKSLEERECPTIGNNDIGEFAGYASRCPILLAIISHSLRAGGYDEEEKAIMNAALLKGLEGSNEARLLVGEDVLIAPECYAGGIRELVFSLSLSYEPLKGLPKEMREDIFTAWLSHKGKDICLHLETIGALEKAKQGMWKELYEQYGIRCFGRYAVASLMGQYNSRERKYSSKPVLVMLAPIADWNGAYMSQHRFVSQLSPYFDVKICETCGANDPVWGAIAKVAGFESSVKAIEAIVNSIASRHGAPYVAQIGGHGTQNTMQFGFGVPGHITTEDISNDGIMLRGMRHNGVVIFNSCSIGIENGAADALQNKYPNLLVNAATGKNPIIEIKPLGLDCKRRPKIAVRRMDDNESVQYANYGARRMRLVY